MMGRGSGYREAHRDRLALRDPVQSHARVIRPAIFIESLVVSRGTDGSNPVPSAKESFPAASPVCPHGHRRAATALACTADMTDWITPSTAHRAGRPRHPSP